MISLRMAFLSSLSCGLASLLAATAALADGPKRTYDAYGYNPPSTTSGANYDWSGVYLGAHLEHGRSSWDGTLDTLTGTVEYPSFSTNGWMFGGHVGYQHQWGPVVLGAEFGYSPLKSSKSFDSVQTAGLALGMRANDLYTYTGKLGYAHDRFLGYIRGGWATTNIGASTDGLLVASSSTRANGWVAGIGLDYAVTQRVILGAEYNNIRFNSHDYSFTDGTTTANTTASGLDIQSVKLRLDFKFN
ncbi:MAG: porin family protein [Hyphomicrobiales bacterium]|nr:MAG: porin family protein [Hyphomicrobiales bacterium]